MIDDSDGFDDDFAEGAPRRRVGMATIVPAISSIELSCRAALYSEKLLMPEIPFIEIEDEAETDVGAPQAPEVVDEELERIKSAIRSYHMTRIAIARSLGAGATDAAFKAACKANGV